MRVDKWIWAVRMVKSRTLAGAYCRQGKVQVNGLKAKPATNLKINDIVTVQRKDHEQIYKVTGFIPKRVSAPLAAENYEDLTPEIIQDAALADDFMSARRERGEGRPTKKDWRDIQKAKDFSD